MDGHRFSAPGGHCTLPAPRPTLRPDFHIFLHEPMFPVKGVNGCTSVILHCSSLHSAVLPQDGYTSFYLCESGFSAFTSAHRAQVNLCICASGYFCLPYLSVLLCVVVNTLCVKQRTTVGRCCLYKHRMWWRSAGEPGGKWEGMVQP